MVIPNAGMGKISEQLVLSLAKDSIRLNCRVASIAQRISQVSLANGETLLGRHSGDEQLIDDVMSQARAWFGDQVDGWQHLKSYPIANAPTTQSIRLGDGLYLCSDFRKNASINGPLVSGRKAAEALALDLKLATC